QAEIETRERKKERASYQEILSDLIEKRKAK
ncbi:MAG: hypothetical protein ACJAYJ_005105, partial [Saprospiraceae bacterium]